MPQPNDLSRSLVALDQDSTIIAVVELSQSSWLVAGVLPGIERQPRKKLPDDLIFVIDPARAPDLDKLVCEQGRNLHRGFAHLRHQQRLFQAADQSHCFRIGRVPAAHGPSHFSFASAVRTQRKSGDQPRAHFNRNDLKCGYFAASTCPAEEGRSQAPWRSKIACNSAIGTARGAQPRVAAKAAAAPAACPVSQHCGISRKKEWLDGSQEMCRPATSSLLSVIMCFASYERA
jgi:hypothetical protein